jgi:hypothetical protein
MRYPLLRFATYNATTCMVFLACTYVWLVTIIEQPGITK